jgi:hypothetical protein
VPPENADAPGGWGPDYAPESYQDVRMLRRAIEEEWPVPRHIRPRILQALVDILDEDHEFDRIIRPGHGERIQAARALMAATKVNLDRERFEFAASLSAARLALEVRKFESTQPDSTTAAADLVVEMRRDGLGYEADLGDDERSGDSQGGDQGGAGPLPE